MKICISSGHGKYISGAVGPQPWGLHEHNEAVKVVNETAAVLREMGHTVLTFEDTTSRDQNTNLSTIVNWHNAQGPHDLDLSIHFNSNGKTEGPLGHEVWYMTDGGKAFAVDIVESVCTASGLKDRGVKHSSGLYFLKHTAEIACLVETCFVTSHSDCDTYREKFVAICAAIADGITDEEVVPPDPEEPDEDVLFKARGRMSTFGGPNDTGVSPSENLAWWEDQATAFREAPHLFLPTQPTGTTGLARRLNPWVPYLACRWDYDTTPKSMLRTGKMALVRSLTNGMVMKAFPADWGPHGDTNRIADLSPGLADALALETDDEVEVIYPYEDE